MSDRLKIVHAIRSDGFSGVERYVLRLAAAQARAGAHVHVIGGDPAGMRDGLAENEVTHTPAARTHEVIAALRARRTSCDVVNTHMTAADLAAFTALAGRRRRPAVVATRHFAGPRGRIGPVPIDRIVGGTIDAELSISAAVAEAIGRPSTVVHSGLDQRRPAELARGRTVLIAQRLQPEKQTALGLDAFARSGIAAAGWQLWIAGKGPERERLEARVEDHALGASVRFLGYRSDVPDLMDRSGILLAPCPVEGLGLTVLEAMQSGLPVVAARAGGHIEVLEGLDDRSLFASADPEAAARALRSLAEDDLGRAQLGAAGRERQRADYTIDAQVQGTDAVYRAALRSRGGGE